MSYDWSTVVADLEQLLKLRSIPFGMQLFEHRADMEAIPRIRRPQTIHTLDQVVGQALTLCARMTGMERRDVTSDLIPAAARWASKL